LSEEEEKEGFMKRFASIGAVLIVFVLAGLIIADSRSINFEFPTYHTGTIDGQNAIVIR